MSHSYKKTPFFGCTRCESEKQNKRDANRKYRRKVKLLLVSLTDIEILPVLREVSDVWGFGKDGKWYYPEANKKELRK